MTRRSKIVGAAILAALALLAVGGGLYVQYFWDFDLFPPGKPVKAVDPSAWSGLRLGMTKAEVIRLLGDSQSKRYSYGYVLKRGDKIEERLYLDEYWQYNWAGGGGLGLPPKAYIVGFGEDGKVSFIRAPLNKIQTAPATREATTRPAATTQPGGKQ